MPIFSFSDDVSWNSNIGAVVFTVEVGEYRGQVTVPARLFRSFGAESTEHGCLAAFFAHRSVFERATEFKIARRALDADGNITIERRDIEAATAPRKN